MTYTAILKIEFSDVGGWIGGHWEVVNESGGYHGLLKTWWDHFGLKGKGLAIGEEGVGGENVKRKLRETYLQIENVYTVGFANADVIWDITKPLGNESKFDWIICQATLEHVKDPVAAIKNMADVLSPNGIMYIHSVGPDFPIHRYPVDCYRFLPDALDAFAELAKIKALDYFWSSKHWFAVYQK